MVIWAILKCHGNLCIRIFGNISIDATSQLNILEDVGQDQSSFRATHPIMLEIISAK